MPPLVLQGGYPCESGYWPLAPVAAIVYFVAFPGHFEAMIVWAERFVR